MKLSKNKISKLLKHKVQSRKQRKHKKNNKTSNKSHTFRNKKKRVNLRTKTLKKYKGGVDKISPERSAELEEKLFPKLSKSESVVTENYPPSPAPSRVSSIAIPIP